VIALERCRGIARFERALERRLDGAQGAGHLVFRQRKKNTYRAKARRKKPPAEAGAYLGLAVLTASPG
jgi:hypothetical protein